jgi:hypothetical protein
MGGSAVRDFRKPDLARAVKPAFPRNFPTSDPHSSPFTLQFHTLNGALKVPSGLTQSGYLLIHNRIASSLIVSLATFFLTSSLASALTVVG